MPRPASPAHPCPSRRPLSRWSAVAGILFTLGLAFVADRATPSDLTLFPYLFPIGLTLYNFGSRAACLLCPIAALLWLAAQPAQGLGAAASRSLLFLLLTLLAARHQRAHRRSRDQLRRLSQLFPLCPNGGQLLGSDGQWHDLDQQLLLAPGLFQASADHARMSGQPLPSQQRVDPHPWP